MIAYAIGDRSSDRDSLPGMGLTDILKGERGLYAIALTIASTVLTALGNMTIDQWQNFNLYLYGIFATAKTATTVTGLIKGAQSSKPAPAPAPAPEVKKDDAEPAKDASAPAPTAETK